MGAEDPHRYNRGERLCNYEPQPRLGGLQAAVEGPRAFRKNQRCISGLEDANKGLQGAAVDPLLINWDHIQLRQKPAKQGHVHQRSPRQKINRAIACSAREGRIEITLMVHRENHRTALNHALPMNYAKTKKKSANQARKIVAKPVIEVHR